MKRYEKPRAWQHRLFAFDRLALFRPLNQGANSLYAPRRYTWAKLDWLGETPASHAFPPAGFFDGDERRFRWRRLRVADNVGQA